MAVAMVLDQISPELVLVDPELAAVERPRERRAGPPILTVVPLGVPLSPADAAPADRRSRVLLAVLLASLLMTGFLVSLLLFRAPSGGTDRPTVFRTVTASSPAGAGRSSRDLRFQTVPPP